MNFVLILMGLFSIVCAVANFNWFMNNRKAALFVKLFGRNGARIFYVILGTAIIIFGVLLQLGILVDS